ncbi:hypothetical protein L7F22_043320, partial [Adiantum nelumboides]|nr:hypothetical protein [Adiantum nelumboides]
MSCCHGAPGIGARSGRGAPGCPKPRACGYAVTMPTFLGPRVPAAPSPSVEEGQRLVADCDEADMYARGESRFNCCKGQRMTKGFRGFCSAVDEQCVCRGLRAVQMCVPSASSVNIGCHGLWADLKRANRVADV